MIGWFLELMAVVEPCLRMMAAFLPFFLKKLKCMMTESERIMDSQRAQPLPVRGGLEMVIERAQRAIDTV